MYEPEQRHHDWRQCGIAGALSRWVTLACAVAFFAVGAARFLQNWRTQFASIGIERFVIARSIDAREADYLAGLRDSHLGVRTLAARRPEIIFFGDSHTYAGWDFPMLQQELDRRVGCVAVSGAFPENLMTLLDTIEANALPTTHVVVGVSPRQFWALDERADRITQADRMLTETRSPRENLVDLLRGTPREIPAFGSIERYRDSQRRLTHGLREVDADALNEMLAGPGTVLHVSTWWREAIAAAGRAGDMADLGRAVGERADALGIHLAFVYIPESAWLVDTYPGPLADAFLRDAAAFASAGDWADLSAFQNGGNPNPLHLNRSAEEGFPYEECADIARAEDWIAGNDRVRRWRFFDPDHMNPAGARAFTERMVPRLLAWIDGQP